MTDPSVMSEWKPLLKIELVQGGAEVAPFR